MNDPGPSAWTVKVYRPHLYQILARDRKEADAQAKALLREGDLLLECVKILEPEAA